MMSAKLQKRFPLRLRALTWLRTDDPVNRERKLLEDYRARFGESPPMNERDGASIGAA